ncbi:inositol-pentakisphosphate 2-kinase [Ciona intestinalis]
MAEESEWIYRVEGNNNVVFSNSKSNQVLRIRKLARRKRHASVPTRNEDFGSAEMDYLVNVVYKLLDGLNVHYKAEQLSVSPQLLDKLSAVISHNRPAELNGRVNLDESATHALLMPDFCRSCLPQSVSPRDHRLVNEDNSPIISVELRPKSCYIPTSLNERNGSRGMCLSCSRKVSLERKPDAAEQSMYCPFDLFSHDSARIQRALRDMIACPQRHLSVRRNDDIIFSQSLAASRNARCGDFFEENVSPIFGRGGTSAFLNLVGRSLRQKIAERPLLKSRSSVSVHCRRKDGIVAEQNGSECNAVPNGSEYDTGEENGMCILDFLSAVKNMCDVPLSEVQRMNDEIQAYVSANEKDAALLSLNLPYNTDVWRRAATLPGHNSDSTLDNQSSSSKLRQLESYADSLRRYTIARAFTCCSLIISFSKLREIDDSNQQNGSFCVEDGYGDSYLCSIAILDLYKEPPNRIDHYCSQTKEFLSVLNDDHKCDP